VAASALRVVEAVGAIWWRVLCEPVVHGCGLVVREREDVAEAAAGVDDCFARLFGLRAGGEGLGDVCVVFDLERRLEMVENDTKAGPGTVIRSLCVRLPQLTCVAPTDVTYGHVPGKLGLNMPVLPLV
jgi:hypothetical protein